MAGPIVTELRADDIRWGLAPAPWPSSAPLMAIVVQQLLAIDDELVGDLVEQLAVAVVERDEELKAVRAVQSAALGALHSAHLSMALRSCVRRHVVQNTCPHSIFLRAWSLLSYGFMQMQQTSGSQASGSGSFLSAGAASPGALPPPTARRAATVKRSHAASRSTVICLSNVRRRSCARSNRPRASGVRSAMLRRA